MSKSHHNQTMQITEPNPRHACIVEVFSRSYAGSKSSGSTTASSYKSDGSKSADPKTPAQISDLSSLLRGRGGGKIIENWTKSLD